MQNLIYILTYQNVTIFKFREHGGRADKGSAFHAEGPAIKPSLRQGFFSIGQIAWSPCERIERLSAFLANRFNRVSVYCDWA